MLHVRGFAFCSEFEFKFNSLELLRMDVILSSLVSSDSQESPDAKSHVWGQKTYELAQPAGFNTLAA